MRKSITITTLLVAAFAMVGGESARGVELLINGNLESSVSPPGFTLTQTVTGLPGAGVSATEQISFANNPPGTPGGLGLFLRPFAGNEGAYADQNQKINVTLSQTVFAVPNRTYTFMGDSYFGGDGVVETNDGYSGGVEFLDPLSPSDPEFTGTVASPTETTFELAFLNASDMVLGAPMVLDLRTQQMNDGMFRTHSIVGVSPAGTAKVRVTASALDMVANAGFQDVFFDNFQLQRDGDPAAVNRLTNGNLDMVGPPNGYTITEIPEGADTIGFRDFANNTTGGSQGLWLRSFENGDGTLSQTVPGVAGGAYAFSAFSKWEGGYSGDAESFPGTTTDTLMELAFLNASSAVIGAPLVLDLDTAGQSNDATWRQYSINGVAPAGTASVRVSAAGIGMFDSGVNPQSAFFDDFSLDGPAVVVPDADLDDDGDVDGIDFLLIQRGFGTTTSAADITNFRNSFGSATIAAGAVPEPASAIGAGFFALTGVWFGRRRRAACL